MPKALNKFQQHEAPTRPQHAPHQWTSKPVYGQKIQFTNSDTSDKLDKKEHSASSRLLVPFSIMPVLLIPLFFQLWIKSPTAKLLQPSSMGPATNFLTTCSHIRMLSFTTTPVIWFFVLSLQPILFCPMPAAIVPHSSHWLIFLLQRLQIPNLTV